MTERPTPAEIVARVLAVLGDALLAAYLFGSATMGGLKPHSDLDVLGVLSRRMTTRERRELVARMLEISGSRARRGPARPVELTLVVEPDVRPWRYPPRAEFLYGEWLRAEYEAGLVPEPAASADLATVLTMVRANGRVLAGPPPAKLLERVPPQDLRRALVDSLPGLLADLETDHNVALTLARVWLTLATGEIAPKSVAASWALERLPSELHPPLIWARDVYLGRAADQPLDVPAVRDLAQHILGRVHDCSAD